MKIHGEFVQVGGKKSAWIDLLNQEEVYDGGYARVVPVNAGMVLKASCCPATKFLLDGLSRLNEKTPSALPCVTNRMGLVAKDRMGVSYSGWLVERLFQPDQKVEQTKARALFRREFGRFKPQYLAATARLNTSDIGELQQIYALTQSKWGTELNWKASREIALQMSLCTTGSLREAFLYLLDLVKKHKVPLDLTTKGNIMVNMFGHPCLSDPVAESIPEYEKDVAGAGLCIGALVPVAVQGITVELKPFSTLALAESEQAKTSEALRRLGLTPSAFEWGSWAHQAFIAKESMRAPIWQYPQAARRIKQDLYMAAFYE